MPADAPEPEKPDPHEQDLDQVLDHIAYEIILLTRYAVQNLPAIKRETIMDRSALILLTRMNAQGPMTVNELAEAFGLNVSTVHRQLKAAIANDLIEVIEDADAPAKLHRPSPHGLEMLARELAARREDLIKIYADWDEEDIAALARLLSKHNQSLESYIELPWPRNA
ncbi:MarR family winged helix-turn-helix transcriptional regulator [Corynebacterium sp. L4756]|uniref:MarR family winged helix-turn-helix transcriptional regulator n=1 Tax=unclassified Corynebacterium TaxID=2624378 RepID=UPI00374D99B4